MHDHKVQSIQLGNTTRYYCACGWMVDEMTKHGKPARVLVSAGAEPDAHKDQQLEGKQNERMVLS